MTTRLLSQPALASLDPAQLASVLDLSHPALTAWRAKPSVPLEDWLLNHFRRRFPHQPGAGDDALLEQADEILHCRFRIAGQGLTQCAEAPQAMNWAHLPDGSVSEAITLTRFYWARPLAHAWRATGDERYVRCFLALAHSFFDAWPLTTSDPSHEVTASPLRWGWIDLQIARRVRHLVEALCQMIHATAMTPGELASLLGWIFDHQQATLHRRKAERSHNMAISQEDGFSEVASTFPEFRASRQWLSSALERMSEALLAQTTPDGVQTEWTPSYHANVAGGALNVIRRSLDAGLTVDPLILQRVRAMWRCTLTLAIPDSQSHAMLPDFGDTKHLHAPSREAIAQAAAVLDDPWLAAYAQDDIQQLGSPSACYPQAGLAILRSRWDSRALAITLHCPPVSGQWHDEPDNHTFEFWAQGHRLMNDTGYYTYGKDAALRAWHRQSCVHQTLTLDRQDTAIQGRVISFSPTCVCMENESYPGLTHRRTVWLIGDRHVALLDEAIGDATHRPGSRLHLHFQFASPALTLDEPSLKAWHDGSDHLPGLMLQTWTSRPAYMEREAGWHAHSFAKRSPREAVCFTCPADGPAVFFTVLSPYAGTHRPTIQWSDLGEAGQVARSCLQAQVSRNGLV